MPRTLASRLIPLSKKAILLGVQNSASRQIVTLTTVTHVRVRCGQALPWGAGKSVCPLLFSKGRSWTTPAREPLLLPQIRHGQSVCLTTPHPLHLLRWEHGWAQVIQGLVEDGPKLQSNDRESSPPVGHLPPVSRAKRACMIKEMYVRGVS